MADWEEVISTPPTGAMTDQQGEKLGTNPDAPTDGEQRLNNVGQLEVYYGGMWIVKQL
jgi:hypothetical protein